MIRSRKTRLLASLLVVGISALANAQNYLEDFQSNQTALFEFAQYAGNTSFSNDGLVIAVPASGDSFGGIGVAPTAAVDLTGTTAIEVTARLDAGNASDLVLSIREGNGMGGDGEFFSFTIPSANFSTSFSTVTLDLATATPFNGDGTDGVLNGPLGNTGIQSPFGGTNAQNVTVQSVNFVGASVVPEPGSLAMLLLALCPALLVARKRRS